MSAGHRLTIFFVIFLLLGGSVVQGAKAQEGEERYFPETGHWVRGDFLAAYEGNPNSLKLYGYPITEKFTEAGSNREVQYFQKVRFELDPNAPATLRVRLSPLGEFLYEAGKSPTLSFSPVGCRNFPQTGFQVCFSFLDFFKKYGGIIQFGYPISNLEWENNRMVQYFQRARFEWHGALPLGQRVVLGDLGIEYFEFIREDPRLRLPTNIPDNVPGVLRLKLRAYVASAVTARQGEQTLFVLVQDQNLQPVDNVQLKYILRLPSSPLRMGLLPSTDQNGISKVSFWVDAPTQGIALIEVEALFESFRERTITEFQIWW